MAKAEIVSSTGSLGAQGRSDKRFYINAPGFVEKPAEFADGVDRVKRIIPFGRATRYAFRGIVGPSVMEHIHGDATLRPRLEVAMPLREFTNDQSWLVSLAHNAPGRQAIVPKEIMQREASAGRDEITSPSGKMAQFIERGFRFWGTIDNRDIDQVYQLWGPTFGWDREKREVEALQSRLAAGRKMDPANRNVWVSILKDQGGTIAGLAMAELLSRPGQSALLDTVELTEWKVNPDYEKQGVMQATIGGLIGQVSQDLRRSPNKGPLYFAECNFATRADGLGASVGLHRPSTDYAPQINEQNVAVGDGKKLGTRLRDFTFMYMPQWMLATHYSPNQVDRMNNSINFSMN